MEYQLQVNMGDILQCLSKAQSVLSPQVGQHQLQVAYLAYRLAEEMGLPTEERKEIFLAALVHDIGALSMKEKLELVDGRSKDTQTHALRGALLVQDFGPLRGTAPLIRCHHVAWADGEGSNWQGQPVPRGAHLLHLADSVCIRLPAQRNVLSQLPGIFAEIQAMGGCEFVPEQMDALASLIRKEYIWFDLAATNPLDRLPQWLTPMVGLSVDDMVRLAEIISHLIDFGSEFTSRHSAGVAKVAEHLASLSSFSTDECKKMLIAGYLHDLGKLAVDNAILEKDAALNAKEFNEVRAHTYYTYYLLDPIPEFGEIKQWAAYHHERLDGTGYPFHIGGDFLPLGSRIMAVADTFTAIAEDRPYRKGIEADKIMEILRNMARKQMLDEQLVELLIENFETINILREAAQRGAVRYYEEFFSSVKQTGTD